MLAAAARALCASRRRSAVSRWISAAARAAPL